MAIEAQAEPVPLARVRPSWGRFGGWTGHALANRGFEIKGEGVAGTSASPRLEGPCQGGTKIKKSMTGAFNVGSSPQIYFQRNKRMNVTPKWRHTLRFFLPTAMWSCPL